MKDISDILDEINWREVLVYAGFIIGICWLAFGILRAVNII
jgi:hypothetical protein